MGISSGDHLSSKAGSYKPMAEINVTPLVDVMLVLLIIFMITSPMMLSGVSVDLPDSEAAPVSSESDPLSVTVDGKRNIYIQERLVEYKNLIPKLEAISAENRDIRIYVRGDRSLDYGYIMQVVGAINGAGFTKVALITERS